VFREGARRFVTRVRLASANCVYVILMPAKRADWVLRRNISRAKIGVSEWAGPTKIWTIEDGMLGGRGRVCVRQSFDGPLTIQLYSCAVQLQN
jgi:hypothetical protein